VEEKYSHRSNGNCKCQNCRTGGGSNGQEVRYDNESSGNMSNSEMINEGVSHKEPFERQVEDIYPNW